MWDSDAPRRLSVMGLRKFLPVLVLLLSSLPMPGARAEGPTVSGAGSTWSQIAVDQWRADVARRGLLINYQGVGSSAGRQFFIIGQVDFAVSEIPFEPDELEKLNSSGRSFQYLPIVAGGTSVMYNLRDPGGTPITSLRLSSDNLAGIFTGAIEKWDDPRIAKDNPGLDLPDLDVIPVIRSDGSGTSAQFSAYLKKMEPQQWSAFAKEMKIQDAPTSYWPNFPGSVAQKGSDGVANYVANDSIGLGAVTYVEAGYAIQRRRPVASIKNASGNYSQPTSENVATALTKARLNSDLTQDLDDVYLHPAPNAYAISSYSYMITQTKGFDEQKGRVLGEFMVYMACAGQQQADVLGYSPLPPNLVEAVFAAIRRIPGAPEPPPLSECGNPTIGAGGVYSEGPEIAGQAGAPSGTGVVESGSGGGGEKAGSKGSTSGGSILSDASTTSLEVPLLSAAEARKLQELAILASDELRPDSTTLLYGLLGLGVALVLFAPVYLRPLVSRIRARAQPRRRHSA